MARIRTIKPDFFRHEALYEAEATTELPLRLAFAGLFTVADREGRFKWKPRVLKLDVLPFDDADFSAVLDALQAHGFVVKYEIDGEAFGHIPSWSKHQHVNQREPDSTIPSPDDARARTCTNIPARREGELEREEEGETRTSSETRERDEIADEFSDAFWPIFPNKVGKPAALKAFRAARKRAPLAEIIDGLRRYVGGKPPDRNWLNPTTFLNQDRWGDEPAAPATPRSQSPPQISPARMYLNSLEGDHDSSNETDPFTGKTLDLRAARAG